MLTSRRFEQEVSGSFPYVSARVSLPCLETYIHAQTVLIWIFWPVTAAALECVCHDEPSDQLILPRKPNHEVMPSCELYFLDQ